MRKAAFLFLIIVMMTFSGCKKDDDSKNPEDFLLTVRNITGVSVSELQIAPESGGSMENRLTENLETNTDIILNLGRLTEEEISKGFQAMAVNAEDGTYEMFEMLMLNSGDKLTFYLDDLGLAAAVNTSDEEIQQMVDRLHSELS